MMGKNYFLAFGAARPSLFLKLINKGKQSVIQPTYLSCTNYISG